MMLTAAYIVIRYIEIYIWSLCGLLCGISSFLSLLIFIIPEYHHQASKTFRYL